MHRLISALLLLLAGCGDSGGFWVGRLGQIELDPTAITFVVDATPPGATSRVTVTVQNLGQGTMRVANLRLEAGDVATDMLPDAVSVSWSEPSGATLEANPLPLLVPAGSSAALHVDYRRFDDATRRLALKIDSNDPRRPVAKGPIEVERGTGAARRHHAEAELWRHGGGAPGAARQRRLRAHRALADAAQGPACVRGDASPFVARDRDPAPAPIPEIGQPLSGDAQTLVRYQLSAGRSLRSSSSMGTSRTRSRASRSSSSARTPAHASWSTRRSCRSGRRPPTPSRRSRSRATTAATRRSSRTSWRSPPRPTPPTRR